MIVCSCNVLSDHDVRHVVNSADNSRRNAKQIYGCLGCGVECGRCARTIKGLIDEALASCDNARKLGASVDEIAKDSGSFEQQTLRANSAFTKRTLRPREHLDPPRCTRPAARSDRLKQLGVQKRAISYKIVE